MNNREKQTGACDACLSGLSADGDAPTARGLKQIVTAKRFGN